MSRRKILLLPIVSASIFSMRPLQAEAQDQATPFFFDSEAMGSSGLGGAGVTHADGSAMVSSNPSLMALTPQFLLDASRVFNDQSSHHGRYGIVDSAKSQTAAGVQYLDYRPEAKSHRQEPVFKRGALAIARKINGNMAYGLNINYAKGELPQQVEAGGVTYGLGLTGILARHWRYGLSAQNLGNGNIKELSPQVRRVGIAFDLTPINYIGLELKQRQLIPYLEVGGQQSHQFESMIIAIGQYEIYKGIRFLGSFAKAYQAPDGFGKRRQLAGGLVFASERLEVGIHSMAPDWSDSDQTYQTISAKFILK